MDEGAGHDHRGAVSVEAPEAAPTPPGLTSGEARRRLDQLGPNTVAEDTPSLWGALLAQFWAPVPWLLEAAIVLQIGLGQHLEAGVIAGLLIFNATLGVFQESRANAALAALKKRLAPTALLRRDGGWISRPAAEVVPGDVIRLTLGARLLRSPPSTRRPRASQTTSRREDIG